MYRMPWALRLNKLKTKFSLADAYVRFTSSVASSQDIVIDDGFRLDGLRKTEKKIYRLYRTSLGLVFNLLINLLKCVTATFPN